MTAAQRESLVGICDSILACGFAPADIRLRAENLRARLTHDFSRLRFGDLLGL